MLIDSHIHLDSEVYSDDLPEILIKADQSGVRKMITPGTSLESSAECIRIAQENDGIYAAVGVHPHDADNAADDFVKRLEEMSSDETVVAIGEIGLDFFKNYSSDESQIKVFKAQLELAEKLNLPVIIHNRDSDAEMEKCLTENRNIRGVVHCYTGGIDFAEKLLSMGYYLGFTGIITFGNEELIEVVKMIPKDRLLIETDGPYMTPVPHRGKRNEPAYLKYIAEKIAQIKNMSIGELSETSSENCFNLFEGLRNGG